MVLPRVLVVAEHASLRFGGEASLPYHFFTRMRERGVEAWLLVHARTREELRALLPPAEFARVHFVEDSLVDRGLWGVERRLPRQLGEQTVAVARHAADQLRKREVARRLVERNRIDVVHEPAPISPKRPSAMYDLGAPVVIGPMCGGMEYPPAFAHMQSPLSRGIERAGRHVAHAVNRLLPGKLRAECLVVANPQTRAALPAGTRGRIEEVIESGVDLRVWGAPAPRAPRDEVRFAFLGRLVDWKGVALLLAAFDQVAKRVPMATLDIVGDGPLRAELEADAGRRGLQGRARFTGWLPREQGAALLRDSDVLVMPSLRECGGTAVLEAMACGLPTVVTDWGGLSHYVDDTCGIRVPPTSRGGLVDGLAEGMARLAGDPELRQRMGLAARKRVTSAWLDWDAKVGRLLELYGTVTARPADLAA
jgi:glycosyltransferase involved in cell wall biosynthesis